MTGTEEEIRAAFETTYNELHDRLEKLVELDLEEINPLGLIASAQKIHRELGGH